VATGGSLRQPAAAYNAKPFLLQGHFKATFVTFCLPRLTSNCSTNHASAYCNHGHPLKLEIISHLSLPRSLRQWPSRRRRKKACSTQITWGAIVVSSMYWQFTSIANYSGSTSQNANSSVFRHFGLLDPRVDHLVHFKNDVWHNIERIKVIWNKNYKGIPNNEGAIKYRQSHYK
jgi:hypothetical protein